MRVDKFLKNSRIIKRRTVAKEACETGRVFINDKEAKPGTEIEVGDKIQINFGTSSMTIKVTQILEHAPKNKAQDMYEVITE